MDFSNVIKEIAIDNDDFKQKIINAINSLPQETITDAIHKYIEEYLYDILCENDILWDAVGDALKTAFKGLKINLSL